MQFRITREAAKTSSRDGSVPSFDPAGPWGVSPEEADQADASLGRSFRGGDEVAFSLVYGRFRAQIARQVRARIANLEAADELVQEVFLKAFRFREQYDPAQRISAWLKTIAANSVADWLRRQRRRSGLAAEFASQAGASDVCVENLPADEPCPEKALLSSDRQASLLTLLGALTPLQRKVLLLRAVHHLSYDEIAARLDLTLSAVKCAMYRVRQRILSAEGDWAGAFA